MDEEKFAAARRAIDWEIRYRDRGATPAPAAWFLSEIDHLDPDFAASLTEYCPPPGRLLEVGAGSGTQAVHYAQMGYHVTATDVSSTCVAGGRELAAHRDVAIDFVCDNIVFTTLRPGFDVICDRGCFTVLEDADQHRYVANVVALLNPGGFLLLKIDKKKEAQLELFTALSQRQRDRGFYGGERRVRSVMAVYQAS